MDTDEIYVHRNNFSIIGLTGKTGSGCTEFADLISNEACILDNNDLVRKPIDILISSDSDGNRLIFRRKYSICYNFFAKKDVKYRKISYISVLLFYSVHYCIHVKGVDNAQKLYEALKLLIENNFLKSTESEDDNYPIRKINNKILERICNSNFEIIEPIKNISRDFYNQKNMTSDQLNYLNNAFYSESFNKFSKQFFELLSKTDYYCGSFFVHRIGNKIRSTGNPFSSHEEMSETANISNIYNVARVINKLIKAYKNNSTEGCHICIDSLRNSLEVMFFKERYSAFYLIAIHNGEKNDETLNKRIKSIVNRRLNNSEIIEMVKKNESLDHAENKSEDFKQGVFFAPDVENCIQKSEIHISNPGNDLKEFKKDERYFTSFYSMYEQWIKIQSLILHPGLITPSHEERCMQIAYNMKFNSGCISRQVGAVITDKNNSIRSVGWNDVPKGSVPCLLRDLDDVIFPDKVEKNDLSYSKFEIDKEYEYYKDGKSFSKKSEKYSKHIGVTKLKGLNYSFCFKSLHNEFMKGNNQVHTRSLHAEENAMLQISKYGGQPLNNGKLYSTASPCELCSKKSYQLGIREIIYIDPYPGISKDHILSNGYHIPLMKVFTGVIGRSYNKIFEPFLSYKDELNIITENCEII